MATSVLIGRSTLDYKPIHEYGLISDMHGSALVGSDGSIDWCCIPRFDSSALFSRILDSNKGGFFKLAPTNVTSSTRRYLPNTNGNQGDLLTTLLSCAGVPLDRPVGIATKQLNEMKA